MTVGCIRCILITFFWTSHFLSLTFFDLKIIISYFYAESLHILVQMLKRLVFVTIYFFLFLSFENKITEHIKQLTRNKTGKGVLHQWSEPRYSYYLYKRILTTNLVQLRSLFSVSDCTKRRLRKHGSVITKVHCIFF